MSADDIKYQKIFLDQSYSLIDYGIILKYPEVIYKDACIIADILSSYDPSEILSFTKPIGERKKISIQVCLHVWDSGCLNGGITDN